MAVIIIVLSIFASSAYCVYINQSVALALQARAVAPCAQPHLVNEFLRVSRRTLLRKRIIRYWLDHFDINERLLLPTVNEYGGRKRITRVQIVNLLLPVPSIRHVDHPACRCDYKNKCDEDVASTAVD